MSGGKARNRSKLPNGKSGAWGGTAEALPTDAQWGDYSRARLEQMNRKFVSAVERAQRADQAASSPAIGAKATCYGCPKNASSR